MFKRGLVFNGANRNFLKKLGTLGLLLAFSPIWALNTHQNTTTTRLSGQSPLSTQELQKKKAEIHQTQEFAVNLLKYAGCPSFEKLAFRSIVDHFRKIQKPSLSPEEHAGALSFHFIFKNQTNIPTSKLENDKLKFLAAMKELSDLLQVAVYREYDLSTKGVKKEITSAAIADILEMSNAKLDPTKREIKEAIKKVSTILNRDSLNVGCRGRNNILKVDTNKGRLAVYEYDQQKINSHINPKAEEISIKAPAQSIPVPVVASRQENAAPALRNFQGSLPPIRFEKTELQPVRPVNLNPPSSKASIAQKPAPIKTPQVTLAPTILPAATLPQTQKPVAQKKADTTVPQAQATPSQVPIKKPASVVEPDAEKKKLPVPAPVPTPPKKLEVPAPQAPQIVIRPAIIPEKTKPQAAAPVVQKSEPTKVVVVPQSKPPVAKPPVVTHQPSQASKPPVAIAKASPPKVSTPAPSKTPPIKVQASPPRDYSHLGPVIGKYLSLPLSSIRKYQEQGWRSEYDEFWSAILTNRHPYILENLDKLSPVCKIAGSLSSPEAKLKFALVFFQALSEVETDHKPLCETRERTSTEKRKATPNSKSNSNLFTPHSVGLYQLDERDYFLGCTEIDYAKDVSIGYSSDRLIVARDKKSGVHHEYRGDYNKSVLNPFVNIACAARIFEKKLKDDFLGPNQYWMALKLYSISDSWSEEKKKRYKNINASAAAARGKLRNAIKKLEPRC